MGILDEIISMNKRTIKSYQVKHYFAAMSTPHVIHISDVSLPFLRNLLEAEGWKVNNSTHNSPDEVIAAYILPDFSQAIHVVRSSDIYDLRCDVLSMR